MNFEDFFNLDEGEYPFEDGREINECYQRWYDMIFAAGLEIGQGKDKETLKSQILKAKDILVKRAEKTDL